MTVKYANKLKQRCIHAMISDWVARYTQFMVPTTPPPPSHKYFTGFGISTRMTSEVGKNPEFRKNPMPVSCFKLPSNTPTTSVSV